MHVSVRPAITSMASRQVGFTMVELIVVLVLVGILAAVAVPKLTAALNLVDESWHDQVVALLRGAQKGAVARRRLTCVSVSTSTVTLTTASVNSGSNSTCNTALDSGDGSNVVSMNASAGSSMSASPQGTLYFQPDGTVTTDAAGTTPTSFTVTAGGVVITINGWSGYVQ